MALSGQLHYPRVHLIKAKDVVDDQLMSQSVVVEVLGLPALGCGLVNSVEFIVHEAFYDGALAWS